MRARSPQQGLSAYLDLFTWHRFGPDRQGICNPSCFRSLGPEYFPPWPDTDERQVLDGSSKRQQPHCPQMTPITRHQPYDLRR